MPKQSAGILLYRRRSGPLEVFLVHPGGPLWAGKDAGAWTIPKGEISEAEPLAAAQREFEEETGFRASGDFTPLAPIRQRSGKIVLAWAVEGDADPAALRSNTFRMEWPRGSGTLREFPEVDRGAWWSLEEARGRINAGQVDLLDQLVSMLSTGGV